MESAPSPLAGRGSAEAARLGSAWPRLAQRGQGSAVSPFLRPDLLVDEQNPEHGRQVPTRPGACPAPSGTSSSSAVVLRAVWTQSVDTEVVPGQAPGASQGRAAPRRRGSGRGVFAGTVRKRRLDPGRGMTVGSGHAWGQLPRDLTEPDPAEVKQGLDAHSRGSRHWGRCTGESRNRGARGPRLSPGFWASWKLKIVQKAVGVGSAFSRCWELPGRGGGRRQHILPHTGSANTEGGRWGPPGARPASCRASQMATRLSGATGPKVLKRLYKPIGVMA